MHLHTSSTLQFLIHCWRNIKERLHDQHFTESEIKNELDDIFGCQHGDVFAEGLVDANSEDEFDEKLETLQERWKAIEERNPPSEALVKRIDGTRLHGAYHHMLQRKHAIFMRALSSLSAWQAECLTNNCSCGTLLSMEPGGKGEITILHEKLGPFTS